MATIKVKTIKIVMELEDGTVQELEFETPESAVNGYIYLPFLKPILLAEGVVMKGFAVAPWMFI